MEESFYASGYVSHSPHEPSVKSNVIISYIRRVIGLDKTESDIEELKACINDISKRIPYKFVDGEKLQCHLSVGHDCIKEWREVTVINRYRERFVDYYDVFDGRYVRKRIKDFELRKIQNEDS